jgi:hypothetical protein
LAVSSTDSLSYLCPRIGRVLGEGKALHKQFSISFWTALLHVTVPASFSTFLINISFLLLSLSDPAVLNVLNVS